MNKRIPLLIIIAIPLLFSSCSKKADNLPKETANTAESNLQTNQEVKLPAKFTTDKVKSALLEYINYRLWLYPSKIMDAVSDKDFDNYIDKSIDVEIRVYNNGSEKSVYAHTSIGQWLAVFKNKDGFVYCDGQASQGEYGWPNNIENYEVIEKYSAVIPQPHKPNYGTSQRKDKMVAAIEAKVRAACEDFYKGADKYDDEWKSVDVYIADFYEHEQGAHAWLCKQDGSVTNFPVNFEEENGGFKIVTLKGYNLENINNYDDNDFAKFQFERDISDAVKHFQVQQ